jgi:Mrp family chromosome partitioning ATPase
MSRRMHAAAIALPASVVGFDAPGPSFLDPGEGTALITMLRRDRGAAAIVQLIAAGAGEGTSTLARDLALIAARMPGLRVLLLDLDPPGTAQLAALRAGFGAAVAATRSLPAAPPELVFHQLAISRLPRDIAVSEMRRPASGPFPLGPFPLGPFAWRPLFSALRKDFDLVLIDSPPLERSYDGILRAQDVDTTLLVVEAERARAAAVRNLRDRIQDIGGQVAGAALNKRRRHVPDFLARRL